MDDLTVFMPRTAQDVLDRAADIELLTALDAHKEPGVVDWLAGHPHAIYLFYLDGNPAAMIRLDDRAVDPTLGKGTVEIHGACLPQYLPLSDVFSQLVMEAAFQTKRKIIAKIPPDNAGAVGWCRRWGFKRINRERGLDVYRLKRSEYERIAR